VNIESLNALVQTWHKDQASLPNGVMVTIVITMDGAEVSAQTAQSPLFPEILSEEWKGEWTKKTITNANRGLQTSFPDGRPTIVAFLNRYPTQKIYIKATKYSGGQGVQSGRLLCAVLKKAGVVWPSE
jgi:hypothetical protein